jgi:hypothetical protein
MKNAYIFQFFFTLPTGTGAVTAMPRPYHSYYRKLAILSKLNFDKHLVEPSAYFYLARINYLDELFHVRPPKIRR